MGAQEQGMINNAVVTSLNIVASAYVSEKLSSFPKQQKEHSGKAAVSREQVCGSGGAGTAASH